MALSHPMFVKTLRCKAPAWNIRFPDRPLGAVVPIVGSRTACAAESSRTGASGDRGRREALHCLGIQSSHDRVMVESPPSLDSVFALCSYASGFSVSISIRYTLITNRNNLYKILHTDIGAIGPRNLWLGSMEEIMKREMISMWALAGFLFAAVTLASVLQV